MTDPNLQSYLDSISALPGELKRSLTTVRDLDDRIEDILKRNEFDQKKFLQELRNAKRNSDRSKPLTQAQLNELLNSIQLDQESCLKMGAEKIDIVTRLYNIIDSHIQKLDSILSKCEADIAKQEEEKEEEIKRRRPLITNETPMLGPTGPKYCICNNYSFGEMIQCDNEECEIEWFHYGCVGLVQHPKGQWYCPICRKN